MPSLLHRQAEAGRHRRPGRALRAPLRSAGQEVEGGRLDQLRTAKLRALVGQHWEKDDLRAIPASALPGGAGMVEQAVNGRAWVLVDDGRVARFGPAVAWAWRRGSASLHVLCEEGVPVGGSAAAAVMARRAAQFAQPGVEVWAVSGRELTPVEPADNPPVGEPAEPELSFLLAAHGIDPVVEHGVLRGEVLGLEVARVIGGRLEVGVGRHDRYARAEMRRDEEVGPALDQAADAVRALRRPGAPAHPANTLARGRWLRSIVCGLPDLAGAAFLVPVAPPVPWFDLPEAGAAPAVGTRPDGSPVVVVCSVGVDLDLVATAADCRAIYSPDAELVLVVPSGDDVPVIRELASALHRPATVVTVERGWPGLATG